jgi:hypothetical protein
MSGKTQYDGGQFMPRRDTTPAYFKTMSVPEAGRLYFGLGRNASYEAARRGDIPTIRIGGRVLAVVAALDRMLDQVPPLPPESAARSS